MQLRPPPPLRAGIGLRAPHCAEFLATRPAVGFVEIHSENLFGQGGRPLHDAEQARRETALSLHGVGLSIGSTDPLDEAYLARLAELVAQLEPALVSDHLCWCSLGGVYANDLLPLPCTDEALHHVVSRLHRVQERLGRAILLENPSSYLAYADSSWPEAEFLAEVARRSGCGILLDVNNVHVSAHNLGFDPGAYLAALPRGAVHEMHLAGHAERRFGDGASLLLDTHGAPVADAVWQLYRRALERFGAVPTLVEWDTDLPPLAVLLAEARRADELLAAQTGTIAEACDACTA